MPEDNVRLKGSIAVKEGSGEAISGTASSGGGTHRGEVPSWVVLDQKLRWWSESQKKFMAVRVTRIDEQKRLVIVTFEADAKVWKSVPFSQLGRRGCPLQKCEGTGIGLGAKQRDKASGVKDKSSTGKKEPSKKEALNKEPADKDAKEPTSKDNIGKDPASKDGSKDKEDEDGTATPNWWVMEKARLLNMDEYEKKEKEELERRRKEKEEQELRMEEQRRLEVLAAERRKVEEAFEMRKREAEAQKLREEEEWRNSLRLRREREAAEEEEREREREVRRKKRQEEKGRKKGKEEVEKKKEAEEKARQEELARRRAEEAQRLSVRSTVIPGMAAVQPWAQALAAAAAAATVVPAAGTRSAPPGAAAAAMAAGWRFPAIDSTAGAMGAAACNGVASAFAMPSTQPTGHAAPGQDLLPEAYAGLKAATRPLSNLAQGLAHALPQGAHAQALAQSQQRLASQALLRGLPQGLTQGVLQDDATGSWACSWGSSGEQDARELFNVLQAHGCVAGSWGNGAAAWAGQ
mmetsp:Transcript_101628/g.282810  ORF Transcript_101628/g.282810 Transcript_101628/m.282810 type:complete len:520 (-) Transcript_101628:97-1656(-)